MKLGRFSLGEARRGRLQLDELDGIRGLAVLFVLFSHLANEDLVLLPFKLSGNASGKIGVFLFFTLSSFLLSRALFVKLESGRLGRAAWTNYSVRRIMRIYPFYILALIFVVFAYSNSLGLFPSMDWGDFWRHVFLLDGKEHLWTIATEVKFYLILPFLVLLHRMLGIERKVKYIFALLFVAITAQVLIFTIDFGVRHSLVRYLPIFTVGTVGAFLYAEMNLGATDRSAHIAMWLSYASILALFLLMPNVMGHITEMVLGYRISFLMPVGLFWGVLCTLLVVSVLSSCENFLRVSFRSTPLRILGAMSFSLYINHWFVLQWILQKNMSVHMSIALFWLITFSVSSVTYLVVERPLANLPVEKLFFRSLFKATD